MGLGVCEGCRRFARGESCPFCGAHVAPPKPLPTGRRTRAGKIVAMATLAMGCGTTAPAPLYGDPAYDSGMIDAPKDNNVPDSPVAMYGLPPDSGSDSGSGDAGTG